MKTTNEKEKWKPFGQFAEKYGLDQACLRKARQNGLPFRMRGKIYLYREKDIHDYYSGKIGNDTKRGGAKC